MHVIVDVYVCYMKHLVILFLILFVSYASTTAVPWGKHTPPGDEQYRLEHKSIKDKDVDANMIIPAVTVRDPYYWMQVSFEVGLNVRWILINRNSGRSSLF